MGITKGAGSGLRPAEGSHCLIPHPCQVHACALPHVGPPQVAIHRHIAVALGFSRMLSTGVMSCTSGNNLCFGLGDFEQCRQACTAVASAERL